MTSSRLVRVNKARVCLYVGAVITILGVIACYNNTLTQLDEVRRKSDACHKQEEQLAVQLQLVTGYKRDLEQSLKDEKSNREQIKIRLEAELASQVEKATKAQKDATNQLQDLHLQIDQLKLLNEKIKESNLMITDDLKDKNKKLQMRIDELQKQFNECMTDNNTNINSRNVIAKPQEAPVIKPSTSASKMIPKPAVPIAEPFEISAHLKTNNGEEKNQVPLPGVLPLPQDMSDNRFVQKVSETDKNTNVENQGVESPKARDDVKFKPAYDDFDNLNENNMEGGDDDDPDGIGDKEAKKSLPAVGL